MKFKNIITLAALAIGLGAFGEFNTQAGFQAQIDTQTNALAVASTNTYALYGDITGNYTNGNSFASSGTNSYTTNGVYIPQPGPASAAFIDCSKTSQASFEVGGWFANTAASASNITFAVYQSTDLKNWASASNVVVSVPATSTNWATTQFNLNSGVGTVLAPYYALRAVQNANTGGVTAPTNNLQVNLFLKAWTKTGI